MYRDLFRYPIIQRLREEESGTKDFDLIARRFHEELLATRFIGMGNPSESGTHLLYYFRQENALPRNLFIHQHEILTSAATDLEARICSPDLKRVVFIDDLCGSGEQSVRYSRTLLQAVSSVAAREEKEIEFQYLVLFGTVEGLTYAKANSTFNVVDAVSRLDTTYRAFRPDSRVFRNPPAGIDRASSMQVAQSYGRELWPRWPLGFDEGQLLLAFHHNVPDNSLPILWWDEGVPPWTPALPRHPKID
jgi:hypothetical protein